MRRYLKELGFSWAKNVYPENTPSPYSTHNPEWTTVAALEFIEENKDGPFSSIFAVPCCTGRINLGENPWIIRLSPERGS